MRVYHPQTVIERSTKEYFIRRAKSERLHGIQKKLVV